MARMKRFRFFPFKLVGLHVYSKCKLGEVSYVVNKGPWHWLSTPQSLLKFNRLLITHPVLYRILKGKWTHCSFLHAVQVKRTSKMFHAPFSFLDLKFTPYLALFKHTWWHTSIWIEAILSRRKWMRFKQLLRWRWYMPLVSSPTTWNVFSLL
jgi:hypothetical protein